MDLPQPDGPTKTTNEPSSTTRSTPWMTFTRAEGLLDALEFDLAHIFSYFTAPKVSPRTSCFWLNQPMMRMGAMAMVEAAESLA